MTADAVKAEEMLAELEAGNELAGSTGSIGAGGMSEEEQALFEELERDAAAPQPADAVATAKPDGAGREAAPASTRRESQPAPAQPAKPQAQARAEPRKPEAEPG